MEIKTVEDLENFLKQNPKVLRIDIWKLVGLPSKADDLLYLLFIDKKIKIEGEYVIYIGGS
jgi:hypothetical protein